MAATRESGGGAPAGTATDREHPQQMVPPTGRADLHHVRGVVVTRALELGDLLALGDQPAVLRQSVTEHVREEYHIHFLADFARGVRGLAEIPRRTDQLRVGITHGVAVDAPPLEFVDESAARETVVNNADITAQHVDGETHGSTRYF